MLGESLVGQNKFAEGEPLLLKGYERLEAREIAIPPQARDRLPEAVDRLIDLYTATGQPDETGANFWYSRKSHAKAAKVAVIAVCQASDSEASSTPASTAPAIV